MPVTAVCDEGALRMWVCRLPVHIGPLGSYEFAADSRKNGAICRVDVGIDSYRQVGKCIWIRPGFPKKALHPAGGQSRPPLQSWYSSKTLRVLTCCRPGRTVRGGFSSRGAKSLQAGNKFLHDCTFLLCPYVVQCIRIFMLLCRFGQIWIDRGRSSWNYSLPPVRWRRCAPPSATALTLFI